MSVKGTIGALNDLKKLYSEGRVGDSRSQFVERIDYAIKHIEELEKYKNIVEEIERFLEPGVITEIPEELLSSRHIDIITYQIKKIKKKYFPEPKIEDATNRYILDKIEEVIKNFLQDIYHIKAEKEIKERNKKGGLDC